MTIPHTSSFARYLLCGLHTLVPSVHTSVSEISSEQSSEPRRFYDSQKSSRICPIKSVACLDSADNRPP
jgi:hypothetical protein